MNLWDLRSPFPRSFSGHHDTINSVNFSPNGNFLASASDDKTVMLWSTLSGKFLRKFDHAGKVDSVSFRPGSGMLASISEDQTVRWWSQEGPALKSPLLNFPDRVASIQFSPDGNTLVSIAEDRTAKLLQMNDTKNSKIIGTGQITAFDYNGKILAVADSNQSRIKLFLLGGFGDPNIEFSTKGPISDMQFSPDDKMLALATAGDRPEIVDFDLDRLLRRSCDLARNYLQNNQKLKESDRHLCDDIPTHP